MPDMFNHITVFISIVVALGLSELVTAWGALLRHRENVRFHWLHAFWSMFMVVFMIQTWWGIWNFAAIEQWSFMVLCALTVQNLMLVETAQILSPRVDHDRPADMKDFFFSNSKVFFLVATSLLLVLTINDIVWLELPLFNIENIVRFGGMAVCTLAAFSQNERFHALVAALASAMFIAFVIPTLYK